MKVNGGRLVHDVEDTRPLYRRVEDYIESLIHGGGLKPGEAIPSLSQLSQTLGVNGLTVRRAIREMTFKRILVTLQGRGTFVAEGAVKRILWVCGVDLFNGDTSSYYADLFRLTAEECKKSSLVIEPIWMPRARSFEAALNANGGENAISGYMFSGCEDDHRLLNHVRTTGKPHVNLSFSQYGKPRTILPDLKQGYRLALEHFRKAGHSQITLFRIGSWRQLGDLSAEGVEFIKLPFDMQSRTEMETFSYLMARDLLNGGKLRKAIYICDDIAARGITRAILELSPKKRSSFDIVVQSSLQGIIPLGLPITYVAYDIAEQAKNALQILISQIEGDEAALQYYCKFRVLEPDSHAALPSTKRAMANIDALTIEG